MRRINNIVIHCQAGHGDLASVKRWWHTAPPNGLGWRNVGYHYWIDYDGKIETLAPLSAITNGVRGHNSDSVHICYRGGVRHGTTIPEDTRTEMQKAALLTAIFQVLDELKAIQDVTNIRILGHRDFPNVAKACPSFDALREYEWITV